MKFVFTQQCDWDSDSKGNTNYLDKKAVSGAINIFYKWHFTRAFGFGILVALWS